jgi:5'-phosphate synthase pdxT subunit
VRVGVLALQGDVALHEAAVRAVGASVRRVRRPEELVGLDAIVLPGGESTTLSMLLDSSGLRGPLASALADGLPALGTCAGMILLASTVLDGRPDQRSFGVIDLTVRRNAYGRQRQSFEVDLAVPVLGTEPLRAVFIRAPQVVAVGPAVEVLATVPAVSSETAGVIDVPVLCRQGSVLVASFHPEVTGDHRVHALFTSMVAGSGAEAGAGVEAGSGAGAGAGAEAGSEAVATSGRAPMRAG